MSLGSFIRKQFIDVLQWTEDTDGVLAWRYPMEDQEIQYGGKLTVRETQVAIFVNEGKVADVFQPGLYTLETRTLPVLKRPVRRRDSSSPRASARRFSPIRSRASGRSRWHRTAMCSWRCRTAGTPRWAA